MNPLTFILSLLQTGLGSLAAYLAAHVLLCLLPAFFIAGALTALVPKEAVTRFLGRNTPKWISYPASALAGFVLAVCSCTIVPLFAGIYKRGAGLGPAMTFLFFAPASNILAILFTGVKIGMDIALARIILCLIFGVLIGLIMAWIFRKDDADHANEANHLFEQVAKVKKQVVIFFLLLVSLLIAGTLKVDVLTRSYVDLELPAAWAVRMQTWLDTVIPPNPSLGIEGISVQGVFLIGLLFLIAFTAFKGMEKIDQGFNLWTLPALGIISGTLILAAVTVSGSQHGLVFNLTGRTLAEILLNIALWGSAARWFKKEEIQEWLWETWRFVKQIIPLLIMGVFLAGIARSLIPPEWIKNLTGQNTLIANLSVVIFAVFIYFPTLVEVPVAQTFLSLGMHRGPLLAYLLADPELSLQSMLVTSTIIGKKKTAVYVILVAIFSTLAGLLYGSFIK